ncbi:MAG: preprotein translocase subunit Sec61beta [Nitrososphaerota archaeon]|nr:preprotein translocase subunit Sec61beta [Nitrososphaerota archaeon]
MRKRKKEGGPMPAGSAGLLRFFEEETEGVKIRPELLVAIAVSLIVVSVLANVFF